MEWDDQLLKEKHYQAKTGDYLSDDIVEKDNSDKLRREQTFIRHDADAIARELMKIFYS